MTVASKGPRAMGRTSESESLQADLERYRQLARELGASGASVLPAGDVVVDERVRLKCLAPRCPRAGQTPNCPPYAPDLDLVRRAVARYSWAILVKCDVQVDDFVNGPRTKDQKERAMMFHRRSADVVTALEREVFRDGYHLAMGFGGGSCKDYLCRGRVCQYLKAGRCRFPYQARPSMEAIGIDVFDLIKKAGWEAYAQFGDLSRVPTAITVGIVFVV